VPVTFLCLAAVAIDGDTLRCRDRGNVRLAATDAPEMPGHCRRGRKCAPGDPVASKWALAGMLTGPVRCRQVDASPSWRGFQATDRYGRMVVRCSVNGRDLGEQMISKGKAVRWT
jgi:micrococcal nuclease